MVFNILMMFSRLIYRHLTASIAVVAVLLLFIAPLVSKMLTEQHISHSTMMAGATTIATHFPDQLSHQSVKTDHNMMLVGGYACGYCELLVHMPLTIGFLFIYSVSLSFYTPPRPVEINVVVRRVALFHSPRAPPAPYNRLTLV